MMINAQEHCPPSETKYAWKCPRCRGKCQCSTCRKAAGLEPLGRPFGPKSVKNAAADSTTANLDKGKSKAAPSPNTETATDKNKAKSNKPSIAQAGAAAPKSNGKPKSKSSSNTANGDADAGTDQDDGINTPPPPRSSKPVPKNTLANILSTASVRAPAFKPLKAPAEAAPPVFEVIPTKLPEDNMRARMWIYESMVRFDKFGLNRGVLSQLDKFEHWTHAMVQDMLSCLLKTIAGLSNIEKGQPTKPFVKAITAFRSHAKSLQRGEPWSAATELLSILGIARTPLAFVEHDIPVEVEAAAAQRSPSPPAARVTRARRAKETNQYEIARQLSLLDSWEEDEFGETVSEVNDDDQEDAVPSKRRRATTQKKSIYVYEDPSDDESMADPDDSARGRRSARSRKAAEKEPAPEIRLTGRQQAIKLQQEQQKQEEEAAAAAAAKQRQEEKDEAHQARSSRKRRSRGSGSVNGTTSGDSDDQDEGVHRNARIHKKRRRLTAGSSDDEADSDDDDDDDNQDRDEDRVNDHVDVDAQSDSVTDSRNNEEQKEVESPDLETKVSILSALIDAAVMADNIAEELKTASDNMAAMDRTHKAANVEMEKEIVDELAELNKRAPSIVSPEYQKWKAEKAALEQDHAWRRQDARVTSELALDTHALRTGPLGVDVDGREYWHLREYQERMPKYTEGRYAWCLVVLGSAFPVDPNRRAEEEAKKEEDKDGDSKAKDEADDSGLTLLDASTDQGKADVESDAKNVKLGLPTSLQDGGDRKTEVDARRICMGANDPASIKALIDYVGFRLERVEYEENTAMQEREKAALLAKEGNGGAANDTRASSPAAAAAAAAAAANGAGEARPSSGGGESMYSVRKAKQKLKDTQEERRKQMEQLLRRLNKSKEYFAWHREEVAP